MQWLMSHILGHYRTTANHLTEQLQMKMISVNVASLSQYVNPEAAVIEQK